MPEVFANRFELLDTITSGGMGDVWSARDLTDDSVVAVKVLRPGTHTHLMRFMREQSLRIHHPHVVTPLAWAGEDDRVGFSMPLVCGGSVATLVGDYGPLPQRYAAELMRQLVQAVRAVHAAGIVHRDIKPANMLLDPTGYERPHMRLTDFGVAQPLDEPRLTVMHAAIGTPGYLSPEQQHGQFATPEQDLYAIGRVGLHLLTGLEPDQALHTPPAGVDPAFWGAMVALTSDNADSRPGLDDIEQVLAAPHLAWQPQHEIEVFQLTSPQGTLDQAMTKRHPRPQPAMPPRTSAASAASSGTPATVLLPREPAAPPAHAPFAQPPHSAGTPTPAPTKVMPVAAPPPPQAPAGAPGHPGHAGPSAPRGMVMGPSHPAAPAAMPPGTMAPAAATPPPPERRRSALVPVLMIVVGLVGLAVCLWLLLAP